MVESCDVQVPPTSQTRGSVTELNMSGGFGAAGETKAEPPDTDWWLRPYMPRRLSWLPALSLWSSLREKLSELPLSGVFTATCPLGSVG